MVGNGVEGAVRENQKQKHVRALKRSCLAWSFVHDAEHTRLSWTHLLPQTKGVAIQTSRKMLLIKSLRMHILLPPHKEMCVCTCWQGGSYSVCLPSELWVTTPSPDQGLTFGHSGLLGHLPTHWLWGIGLEGFIAMNTDSTPGPENLCRHTPTPRPSEGTCA